MIDRHLARDAFVLLTTPELLAELDRVLGYAKLRRYYREGERARFVALILALSGVVVLPDEIPRICRDPDDDRVVACAAGDGGLVVSGDCDLLAHVGHIPILSAMQFLERLAQGG